MTAETLRSDHRTRTAKPVDQDGRDPAHAGSDGVLSLLLFDLQAALPHKPGFDVPDATRHWRDVLLREDGMPSCMAAINQR